MGLAFDARNCLRSFMQFLSYQLHLFELPLMKFSGVWVFNFRLLCGLDLVEVWGKCYDF